MIENLFLTYFKELEDPRSPINKLHELNTVYSLVILLPCAELKHGNKWNSLEKLNKN